MTDSRILHDLSDVKETDWVLHARYPRYSREDKADEEMKRPVQISKIWKNGVLVVGRNHFKPPQQYGRRDEGKWMAQERGSTHSPSYIEPFPEGREPGEWAEKREEFRLQRKAESEASEAKAETAKQKRLNSIESLESLASSTMLPGGELYIVPGFTSSREDDIALLITSVQYKADDWNREDETFRRCDAAVTTSSTDSWNNGGTSSVYGNGKNDREAFMDMVQAFMHQREIWRA